MTKKIDELLKVLDMPEEEQCKYFYDKIDYRCVDVENIVFSEDEGLALEFAGEIKFNKKEMADLAFRLNGGKIAGKKPIKWIIDALIEKEENK